MIFRNMLTLALIVGAFAQTTVAQDYRYYRHPDGVAFKVPRYVDQGEDFKVTLRTIKDRPIRKVGFFSFDGARHPLFNARHQRKDMKVEVVEYETRRVEGGIGKYIAYLLSVDGRQYYSVLEMNFTARINQKGRVVLHVLHYSPNDGGHNKTTRFIIDVR